MNIIIFAMLAGRLPLAVSKLHYLVMHGQINVHTNILQGDSTAYVQQSSLYSSLQKFTTCVCVCMAGPGVFMDVII